MGLRSLLFRVDRRGKTQQMCHAGAIYTVHVLENGAVRHSVRQEGPRMLGLTPIPNSSVPGFQHLEVEVGRSLHRKAVRRHALPSGPATVCRLCPDVLFDVRFSRCDLNKDIATTKTSTQIGVPGHEEHVIRTQRRGKTVVPLSGLV